MEGSAIKVHLIREHNVHKHNIFRLALSLDNIYESAQTQRGNFYATPNVVIGFGDEKLSEV